MEETVNFLAIWGLVGWVLLTILPPPKKRVFAITVILLGGPIVWIICPFVFIDIWMKDRRDRKDDRIS